MGEKKNLSDDELEAVVGGVRINSVDPVPCAFF